METKKVLIVDDSVIVHRQFKQIFEDAKGFEIAGCGKSGLEAKIGQWTHCRTDPEHDFSLVTVQIVGDVNCKYALSVSRDVAVRIASGKLNVDGRNEPDEMLSESAKEFCNLVCGNFRSLMKHNGKTLEISYPVELPYE